MTKKTLIKTKDYDKKKNNKKLMTMTKDDYCKNGGSCVLDCGGKSERAASASDISERKGEGVAVALRAKHLKFDVPRLTSSCPLLCMVQRRFMVSAKCKY